MHNNLALIHLRKVKKGDQIFFYHTGSERAVVGIMMASGDAYPTDKADIEKSREISVDVVPCERLNRPVSLEEIKSNTKFKDFLLLRISRLSVMPVSDDLWREIMRKSNT